MVEASNRLRMVTAQEAQNLLSYSGSPTDKTVARYVHTVAAEPERIAEAERRGAVKALLDFAELVGQAGGDDKNLDSTTLERIRWTAIDTAHAIENGTDL